MTGKEKMGAVLDRNLMGEAIADIESLRKQNQRLASHVDLTERMLALFEGGPRPGENMAMAEDMVWRLRRRIESLDEQINEATESATDKEKA